MCFSILCNYLILYLVSHTLQVGLNLRISWKLYPGTLWTSPNFNIFFEYKSWWRTIFSQKIHKRFTQYFNMLLIIREILRKKWKFIVHKKWSNIFFALIIFVTYLNSMLHSTVNCTFLQFRNVRGSLDIIRDAAQI